MKVKIIGIEELKERIAEYSVLTFPHKYTRLSGIKKSLLWYFKRHGGSTETFGISVCPYWGDRCYGFQYVARDGGEVVYKFIGMIKC